MRSRIDLYWAALTTGPMVVELVERVAEAEADGLVDEEWHHLLQLVFRVPASGWGHGRTGRR